MKLLIINNRTKLLDKLIMQFDKIKQVDIVDFKDLTHNLVKNYDAIILSGGSYLQVEGHEKEYAKEIELIKNLDKPILGICLGFELIAKAFGAKLEILNKLELGNILMIETNQNDKIFKSLSNPLRVHECHRWVVKSVENLEILGKSKDGIEAIKHPKKLIYGVQFHPEVFVDGSNGFKIIQNFIELI